MLVREIRSLEIFSGKKEAKLSTSEHMFVCYYCAVATVNELRMSTFQ